MKHNDNLVKTLNSEGSGQAARIAYLDCFSGASGDMLLGALIDAGLPEKTLRDSLNKIGCSGFQLNIVPEKSSTLKATRVDIQLTEKSQQPRRHFADIKKMLESSSLEEQVRHKSIGVFHRLAEAEAAVHGCSMNEVHFHEVGAMDAIVDIVGAVSGFFCLGIKQITCSPLPFPRGWVNCAHGELPVPAPAVCKLLHGVPVYGENLSQELITPTGAAIIREMAGDFGPLPPMRLETVGYGAGSMKRNDGRPNLLRLIIGKSHSPAEEQRVIVIKTTLDDWSPETWPFVAEKLLQNGALDVILTPVHMKKGRPGFELSVVCAPAGSNDLKKIILSETSAIGLRFHTEERLTLPRKIIDIQTPWGLMKAKEIETPQGVTIVPEYEECRRVASENNISIQAVYKEVNRQDKEA